MNGTQEESIESASVNVRMLFVVAGLSCLFVLGDLLYLFSHDHHPHVKYEGWFGFFGVYAALFTVALLVLTKLLSRFFAAKGAYEDE